MQVLGRSLRLLVCSRPGAVGAAWLRRPSGQPTHHAGALWNTWCAQGSPCLFDMAQDLQQALDDRAQALFAGPSDASGGSPAQRDAALRAAGGGGREGSGAGAGRGAVLASQEEEEDGEVLLLRLHHMHDRALYTRTLRAWTSELGLAGRCAAAGSPRCAALRTGATRAAGPYARPHGRPALAQGTHGVDGRCLVVSGAGRLLFLAQNVQPSGGGGASGPIILLLLGPGAAVKAYLARHRTQTVDVDSRGRKVRGAGAGATVEEASSECRAASAQARAE